MLHKRVCAKVPFFYCHSCIQAYQCLVLIRACLHVCVHGFCACVCVCIVLCSFSSLEDVTCVGKDSVKGGRLGGGQHSH